MPKERNLIKSEFHQFFTYNFKASHYGRIRQSPIIYCGKIIGALGKNLITSHHYLYLREPYWDSLEADLVVRYLIENKILVLCNTNLESTQIMRDWGFCEMPLDPDSKNPKVALLYFPARTYNMKVIATTCLVEPDQNIIFTGEKLEGGWKNSFIFPGGKVKDKEDPQSVAEKRLKEETRHIVPSSSKVQQEVICFFADRSKKQIYKIHTFIYFVKDVRYLSTSSTNLCFWRSIDDVLKTKHKATTRFALRVVKSLQDDNCFK